MKICSEYALRPTPCDNSRSEVLYDGHATDLVVDGLTIEMQLRTHAGILLFCTLDCPFEEALHIYLLDEQHTLRDSATIGQPMTPAIFQNPRIENNSVEFEFLGDLPWRVTVLEKPAGLQRRWLKVQQPSR